jgi:hypothetical protein
VCDPEIEQSSSTKPENQMGKLLHNVVNSTGFSNVALKLCKPFVCQSFTPEELDAFERKNWMGEPFETHGKLGLESFHA